MVVGQFLEKVWGSNLILMIIFVAVMSLIKDTGLPSTPN